MNGPSGGSVRSYLTMPWGQVHLRTAGREGDPVLVMVHQSPLSSLTFDAVLPHLARQGLRVVAPDTPGFGMSDPTPSTWSIAEYAEALRQVLDALGLDEVVLLGQHTGAVVAAELARTDRARVAGLVLQGLPLYSEEERAEKQASYAPGYVPALDGSHLRVIWERIRGLYPALSAAGATRQVGEYLATGPDYGTAYRAVFAHRVDTQALQSVPVALVHGHDDLVHRFTDTVVAALPDARLEVVRGTDFAPDEFPEEFAGAVGRHALDFLAPTRDVVR